MDNDGERMALMDNIPEVWCLINGSYACFGSLAREWTMQLVFSIYEESGAWWDGETPPAFYLEANQRAKLGHLLQYIDYSTALGRLVNACQDLKVTLPAWRLLRDVICYFLHLRLVDEWSGDTALHTTQAEIARLAGECGQEKFVESKQRFQVQQRQFRLDSKVPLHAQDSRETLPADFWQGLPSLGHARVKFESLRPELSRLRFNRFLVLSPVRLAVLTVAPPFHPGADPFAEIARASYAAHEASVLAQTVETVTEESCGVLSDEDYDFAEWLEQKLWEDDE
jgi:hypothetical protein